MFTEHHPAKSSLRKISFNNQNSCGDGRTTSTTSSGGSSAPVVSITGFAREIFLNSVRTASGDNAEKPQRRLLRELINQHIVARLSCTASAMLRKIAWRPLSVATSFVAHKRFR